MRADHRIARGTRHVLSAALEGTLIAALAVGLLAGTVAAGKPGATGSGGPSISNGTFAGTTTATAGSSTATWVRAMCYQNGSMVFEQFRPYDSARQATFVLGPTPAWSGGSAECKAQDGFWRRGSTWRVVGTTSFSVDG
jgi:hypothetical protein